MRGIHRVVAAVIKEVANIVRLEYFDQPFVLYAVFFNTFELVACGAERATGCMTQGPDRGGGLPIGVDHVFGQRTDNAVAPAYTFEIRCRCLRAASMTAQAEVLMTAVTPPDCA